MQLEFLKHSRRFIMSQLWKATVVAVLMVFLASGVLFAGGNQEAETQEENGEVVITFLSWLKNQEADVEALIAAFEAENPGIRVEHEIPIDNDANEFLNKTDLMLASGETADVILQPNVSSHVERAQRGVYLPIDSFADAEGVELNEMYSVILDVDGNIYGISANSSPWYVMMNKGHLDEAGLSVPDMDWTWQEYREYARALTQGEGAGKRYGSYMHGWGFFNHLALFSAKLDTPYYKEDGSLNFDDPTFREFLRFKYEMENVDETQVPLFEVKASQLGYMDMFVNERASMVPIGSWTLGLLQNQEQYPHDFKTAIAPFPRWGTDAPAGRVPSGVTILSVNKNSEHPEAAYKFIRFYTTVGQSIRKTISTRLGADNSAALEAMLGENPSETFDVDSVTTFFNNRVDNVSIYTPPYHQRIDAIFAEEAEKYMVGGQTLDEAINNMIRRGERVVEEWENENS